MTIETKFNINDTIWFILRDKIRNGKISSINTQINRHKDIEIKYGVVCDTLTVSVLNEDSIFRTKEELLKSL